MPIINPFYFYLMDVADSIKIFSVISLLTIALVVTVGSMGFFISYEFEDIKFKDIKWNLVKRYLMFPFLVLMSLAIFTPSSSTLTKMIIAENITVENYEIAKGEITELIDYIFDKINNKGE